MHEADLPIGYCVSLVMVTINSHIFINIFQMKVFLYIGFEKNMSFLVIAKSPKVLKIKVEKIGMSSFKLSTFE